MGADAAARADPAGGAVSVPLIARSLALFVLVGLMESGGGYLVWLWLREGRGVVLGALGGLLLVLYGVVPTLQPAHFGRVYAAYGGVFVILSLLWAGGSTAGPRTGSTCWAGCSVSPGSRSSCTGRARRQSPDAASGAGVGQAIS
jgi:small multidrug resistance family-3 protein